MQRMSRELSDVSAENAELRRSVARLRMEVDGLRTDPSAVARIARNELGLVRKNEIVFQFAKAK
jgi:cell division protein FtsB